MSEDLVHTPTVLGPAVRKKMPNEHDWRTQAVLAKVGPSGALAVANRKRRASCPTVHFQQHTTRPSPTQAEPSSPSSPHRPLLTRAEAAEAAGLEVDTSALTRTDSWSMNPLIHNTRGKDAEVAGVTRKQRLRRMSLACDTDSLAKFAAQSSQNREHLDDLRAVNWHRALYQELASAPPTPLDDLPVEVLKPEINCTLEPIYGRLSTLFGDDFMHAFRFFDRNNDKVELPCIL